MQTTKAAFGWVGGKSKLAKDIIALMPKHDKYVEVFGGALSVFYQKEPSKIEVVNDINGELINLHRVIKTRPQSLSVELNNMLRSREIFYLIKDKKIKPRNNIQRAAFYFYLISLSFGAKGNNFAMCKGRNSKNIYRDFTLQSRKLKRAVIENMSYERLIKEYDSNDTLFYLDPPYVGTESYYKTPKDFNIADHKNLSYMLNNINAKFILSYNDCDLVRELYSDFIIKELNIRYTLNAKTNKINKELLIMNF
ncbi:adenine-specific DNA methyltransferase [Campylobacter pinnipediorum subsp. caledonicus]|uniref:site-specific DNA-methyltransferase (adenine-specific) n=1 Tax=Campylobacter pinnipediorum subsp. caledonicus TaxID=1874362 RepID=A0A1S6U8B7_9BACT|nr:DNA adenine methylase [Campylobacter pinnipediorum]AQW87912.1 adenine-specific DNA methyltransferase [Campylobacter pinnipediorum subsp. caledonicus]